MISTYPREFEAPKKIKRSASSPFYIKEESQLVSIDEMNRALRGMAFVFKEDKNFMRLNKADRALFFKYLFNYRIVHIRETIGRNPLDPDEYLVIFKHLYTDNGFYFSLKTSFDYLMSRVYYFKIVYGVFDTFLFIDDDERTIPSEQYKTLYDFEYIKGPAPRAKGACDRQGFEPDMPDRGVIYLTKAGYEKFSNILSETLNTVIKGGNN